VPGSYGVFQLNAKTELKQTDEKGIEGRNERAQSYFSQETLPNFSSKTLPNVQSSTLYSIQVINKTSSLTIPLIRIRKFPNNSLLSLELID